VNDIVAIELGNAVARALALRAWGTRPHGHLEMAWDPAQPAALVAALRRQFGPTRRIALAIGLGFLHVKVTRLPPAPLAERRRMLALEPDRFFAVQDEPLVVALAAETDLAFAAHADLLARWLDAFAQWAPIEVCEAAPVSLARVLGRRAHGTFAVPAGVDEHGVIELRNGRLHAVRRIPPGADAQAAVPLPARKGLAPEFLCSLGSARGVTSDPNTMLLTDTFAAKLRRRRTQRIAATAAVCLAAFALAVWSLDAARARTLHRIDAEIASLSPQAARALALRDSLATARHEALAITDLTGQRADPLPVLRALSEQLPPGVTVLHLRMVRGDWQIDGTAVDAAAIVPLLARDPRFQDVRFLSASSRFREDDRTLETFSIAFRVRSNA